MKAAAILKNGFFLLAISISQFAHSETLKTCHLEGKINLKHSLDVVCHSPVLEVAEGTQIITNGYELNLRASAGHIAFRSPSCLHISDLEGGGNGQYADDIVITADTLEGCLVIDSGGSNVTLDALTYKDFHFSASVNGKGNSPDGHVQAFANGEELPPAQLKSLQL